MKEQANVLVAQKLHEVAEVLRVAGANPFRVRAYELAAQTVEKLEEPIRELVAKHELESLPGIGPRIARSIRSLIETGRLPMLDRVRSTVDPETILCSVPGIGKVLARRLHRDLGLDSLEALEVAAHDGRLFSVAGRSCAPSATPAATKPRLIAPSWSAPKRFSPKGERWTSPARTCACAPLRGCFNGNPPPRRH